MYFKMSKKQTCTEIVTFSRKLKYEGKKRDYTQSNYTVDN